MEYAFLAIAIVSEVIATSYLKQTEGFTKLTPSLICAAAYIVCHYTFAKSLNRINLNIGYATWCGVGLIVTSLVSIFAYKEKLSTVGIIGFSFLCHGSHGFLRFCFLHFTGSVFDFQGAIVTRWPAIVTALIVHYSCIQLVSTCLF